ncbi:hypothetical protein AVEN_170079-1 [Araneus ventricosus]|uniref:Uncharacterized protein n=1 Tax=Araneus ventricosus TaxID=182803 RepID=A0A4Y2LSY8_ARAVE|nr:hypothetical protein AVEN_170079-1 [Araneus ventricosus]
MQRALKARYRVLLDRKSVQMRSICTRNGVYHYRLFIGDCIFCSARNTRTRQSRAGLEYFFRMSQFSLASYTIRTHIWRKCGISNPTSNIIERNWFRDGGVLIWGGFIAVLTFTSSKEVQSLVPAILPKFSFSRASFLERLWVPSSSTWTTMPYLIVN